MSIKLIASDMDGTLLDPQGKITAQNIAAIGCLAEKDIEFLICSGRDYTDAKNIMEGCGITCGYICLSGALTFDRYGTMQSEIPLTSQNLFDIEKIFSDHQVPMEILTAGRRYTTASKKEKLQQTLAFLKSRAGTSPVRLEKLEEAARKRVAKVTFIRSLKEIAHKETIFKICGNGLAPQKAAGMKDAFSAFPDLAAASSFPTNIELTNSRAQKGLALKAYAERKGISLKDIMVLGDSDNDLSMFTPEFGWTVAMENSMNCILDAAKYRTKSNAEDGVAWAVKNYALEEKV